MAGLGGLEWLRERVGAAMRQPFGHGATPLASTHEHPGDPGLFGPESVTWQVMGRTATFIGGIRGLLVQAAHPEVVAGVDDHSRYRQDPFGRLSRTAFWVTTTAFGAMPEVEAAVATVRDRHRPVIGTSHRDRDYDAAAPGLAAWVHNALTDSFLVAHRAYDAHHLTAAQADRFVAEQARVGALLDADPMPTTAAGLSRWIATHPDVAPSPGMRAAVAFLRDPPLATTGQRAGYRVLFKAAVAILPAQIRDVLGLAPTALGLAGGIAANRILRAMVGDSPAWRAALRRVGAPTPASATFRRKLPARASADR